MKLSKNTEWILVGVLIVYIAFVQPAPALQNVISTPVGKVLALGAIVYVWKYVSAIVSILLAIAFLRCMSMPRVWEMFSGAETECLCDGEGYTWDSTTKKCTNAEGKEGTIKSCVCASGYAWDGGEKGTKQCVASSGSQPPLPVPEDNPIAEKVMAMEAAANAAPAVTTAPVTSSAPMTTPGAAAQMAAGATGPAATPSTGGVQPGATTTSSTPATL